MGQLGRESCVGLSRELGTRPKWGAEEESPAALRKASTYNCQPLTLRTEPSKAWTPQAWTRSWAESAGTSSGHTLLFPLFLLSAIFYLFSLNVLSPGTCGPHRSTAPVSISVPGQQGLPGQAEGKEHSSPERSVSASLTSAGERHGDTLGCRFPYTRNVHALRTFLSGI